MKPERISKLLAERGLCSRREAEGFIRKGWVLLEGKPVTQLGAKALPTQDIRLAESAKRAQRKAVTLLLNKPVGFVSEPPEPGRPYRDARTLLTPSNQVRGPGEPRLAVEHLEGLAPAGRLDIEAQGLMVFTQDGRVARQLVGEGSRIEREYLVRVGREADDRSLGVLRGGNALDGRFVKPIRVERINREQIRLVLPGGSGHRAVQRLCALAGLRPRGLKRVRIGGVRLGGLPPGKWRSLRPWERF
jgi:23S rRNA pseudouridine2604 synthase